MFETTLNAWLARALRTEHATRTGGIELRLVRGGAGIGLPRASRKPAPPRTGR